MPRAPIKLMGNSGRVYRLLRPLDSRRTSPIPSIWAAVDDRDESQQYVVKQPKPHDPAPDYPIFEHEAKMQRLFSDSPFIRKMLDFVPVSATSKKPAMVLQAFERTLWDVRWKRPLTKAEIKWTMKAVIIGMWTIHRKGLVYTDLKMENIMVDGFDEEEPGHLESIIVRVADCGLMPQQLRVLTCERTVQEPDKGEITSLTYRSPEVYYRRSWSQSTDIWSWGIMLCHLLEAQAEFLERGLYDSMCEGTLEQKSEIVRRALAQDFQLRSEAFYTNDEDSQSLLLSDDSKKNNGQNDVWSERIYQKGVPLEDIEFLFQILNPDPTQRWTADEIIGSGYLDAY